MGYLGEQVTDNFMTHRMVAYFVVLVSIRNSLPV